LAIEDISGKQTNNISLIIFDGGHEMLPDVALELL
jgi:hypothetical protein